MNATRKNFLLSLGRAAALFLATGGIAGCATALTRADPLRFEAQGEQVDVPALVEELLRLRGVRVQTLEGAWNGKPFAVQCVLKAEDGKTTCAFVAPMMRLATLVLEPPHALRFERAAALPAAFEPEYALFDLALVHLPPDRLAKALGPRWTVQAIPGGIRVATRQGVFAVKTTDADGVVHVENLLWKYAYAVHEEAAP